MAGCLDIPQEALNYVGVFASYLRGAFDMCDELDGVGDGVGVHIFCVVAGRGGVVARSHDAVELYTWSMDLYVCHILMVYGDWVNAGCMSVAVCYLDMDVIWLLLAIFGYQSMV